MAVMRVLTAALAGAAGTPLAAQTDGASLDLSASAGFSSNPLLRPGDDTASGFVELSINPRYLLSSERGSTVFDLSYRRTEYFDDYDATQSYGASVQSQEQLTEKLLLRAELSFDSSILGERGSDVLIPVGPIGPVEPGGPDLPDIDPDLGLLGLGQRQNKIRGGLGAEYRRSELDLFTGEFNVERTDFRGEAGLSDYRSFSGTIGYSRAISERTQVGGRLAAQLIDYDLSGSSSTVFQPQATLETRLSPQWSLTAAAGLLIVNSERGGLEDDSIGVSASVTGCREDDRSSLCLLFQRDAAPSGVGEVLTRTAGSVDYSYRLGERSNLRAHADLSSVEEGDFTGRETLTYANVSASYDRAIGRRLTGGVLVAYRDIYGSALNRSADVGGQLFIRARLGRVQ
jgi:hypothetical protein